MPDLMPQPKRNTQHKKPMPQPHLLLAQLIGYLFSGVGCAALIVALFVAVGLYAAYIHR
jgi:hypothetical protein